MPDGVPCLHTGATFADTYKLIRWSGTEGHCAQGYCRVCQTNCIYLLYVSFFIILLYLFHLLINIHFTKRCFFFTKYDTIMRT